VCTKLSKMTLHASGLSGGVQFVMDTLTHEYYIGPFSYSEGFSVCHLNI